MLSLQIAAGPRPLVSHLRAGSPWRDDTGAICAHIYRDDKARYVQWPSMGLFAIGDRDPNVCAWADAGVAAASLQEFFNERLLPLALQTRGYEALHASAVSDGLRALVIAGVSGSGKSTLARALSTSGFQQIADDAVVIETDASPPLAHRVVSRSHTAPATESLPLGAIVILTRDAGCETPQVLRLPGPQACIRLMTHAHVFEPDENPARLVSDYSRLANQVQVSEIRFRPEIGELPALMIAARSTLL